MQEQNKQLPEFFKGFSLFNDIEDMELRQRNRAVIMTNILEDNFLKGKVSSKGALLIMGYFSSIPEEEKEGANKKFIEITKERGFTL